MGYYKKQHKILEGLIGQDPTYAKSPFAQQQLKLAQTMFGGRMFGAPQRERNILASQGNTWNNIGRFATDASQALALGSQAQENADQATADLQMDEAQNQYNMLDNLNRAYGVNIQEDQNVEADKVRKFGNLVQIRGAQAQNALAKRKALWNTVGGIVNLGVGAFTGGLFGGGAKGNGGGSGNPYSSIGVQGGSTYTGPRNYQGYRG